MPLSLQVKRELIRVCRETEQNRNAALLTGLTLAVRQDGVLHLSTSLEPYADLVEEVLHRQAGVPSRRYREHGHWAVVVETAARAALDGWMRTHGLDPDTRCFEESAWVRDEDRRALLRGFFLAGGAIGEPKHGYHLEFSGRYEKPLAQLCLFLEREELRPHRTERGSLHILYIKDGNQIADFLLVTGAHAALLSFENLRVEKDMRNTVNRMVNCDTANSSRLALTAARQLESIRILEQNPGLSALPKELRAAAHARMKHPEWSIQELGEAMDPPIGKSGMSHRLRRLEQMAADRSGD